MFSSSYLAQPKPHLIDPGLGIHNFVIRSGTVYNFETENALRICRVTRGKLKVTLHNLAEESLGPRSAFKIRKGQKCSVTNEYYIDAELFIVKMDADLGQ